MANTRKKCKQCKQYIPAGKGVKINTGFFCSIESAMIYARGKASKKKLSDQKASDKAERAELRKRKESIKSKSEWLREAQAAFNRWVRLRDHNEPCISCQRHHQGQYHAGHYLTVGANPELRFDELNVWKQCSACNNYLSGNLINYRINLLAKIGQEGIDYLEGPHQPKKYTIDDIKAIKAHYAKLGNELQKSLN